MSRRAKPKRASGMVTSKTRLSMGTGAQSSDLKGELQAANEKIVTLEREISGLKDRMQSLRKAQAATTRVVKAPTRFDRPTVKLPAIDPKATSHDACKAEIQALKDQIEDEAERHRIEVDGLKHSLQDKIADAKGMGTDIDRLQARCQALEHALARQLEAPTIPATTPEDSGRVEELERKLKEANEAAGAAAHIAASLEGRCTALEADLKKNKSAFKEKLTENTQRVVEIEEAASRVREEFKSKEGELKQALALMKEAWTKRETDWLEYNKRRESQWKEDAAAWIKKASGKLNELKDGSALLQRLAAETAPRGGAAPNHD